MAILVKTYNIQAQNFHSNLVKIFKEIKNNYLQNLEDEKSFIINWNRSDQIYPSVNKNITFIKGEEKTEQLSTYQGGFRNVQAMATLIPVVYTQSLFFDGNELKRIFNYNPAYHQEQAGVYDPNPTSIGYNLTITLTIDYGEEEVPEQPEKETDYSQTVLYAKDKTREDFDPSGWSSDQGSQLLINIIKIIYPIGSFYITTNTTNPSTLFPQTEWEQIKNTFLWAGGDDDVGLGLNKTTAIAGSKKAYLPNHTHTLNSFATNNNTTATSHSHYPAARTNTNYKEYNRKYAGWIGVMPDCTSTTAAQNLSKSIGQQSYANLSSGNKTMPYAGSNAIDFFWGNETTTVSTVHNHSIPAKDTTTVKTSSTNADIIPNDNRDIATANMPPYLPVYVWKRIL